MRRIVGGLLGITLLTGGLLFVNSPTSSAAPNDPVVFNDPILEASVLAATGKTAVGFITEQQASSFLLNRLVLENLDGVTDWTGLDYFTRTSQLVLDADHGAPSIAPLVTMPRMQRITFQGSAWGNNHLQELAAFPNLTGLVLDDTPSITDYTLIPDITTLTALYILNNQLDDVTPLSTMTQLTILTLQETGIEDASPLGLLVNLVNLSIRGAEISDISWVSPLTKITDLRISETNISDTSYFASIDLPRVVQLNDNKITDISSVPLIPGATLTMRNQEIINPTQSTGFVFNNPLIALDGSVIVPTISPSSGAVYDAASNTIIFEEPGSYQLSFESNLSGMQFSGIIHQEIIVAVPPVDPVTAIPTDGIDTALMVWLMTLTALTLGFGTLALRRTLRKKPSPRG